MIDSFELAHLQGVVIIFVSDDFVTAKKIFIHIPHLSCKMVDMFECEDKDIGKRGEFAHFHIMEVSIFRRTPFEYFHQLHSHSTN